MPALGGLRGRLELGRGALDVRLAAEAAADLPLDLTHAREIAVTDSGVGFEGAAILAQIQDVGVVRLVGSVGLSELRSYS